MSLVEFGCDVNAVDYDLRAPLHAAAGEGNVHVIGFLLGQRADVNASDHRGCTPLDEAVRTSQCPNPILGVLLQAPSPSSTTDP